ncbi:hypothetical protein AKO1_014535 [Acrasis kona]|uniref:Macro domain-containing protein n=1 Tax=Acrasis kona TaxID=1008807 RepID=A0AAW2Z176_9EUKA
MSTDKRHISEFGQIVELINGDIFSIEVDAIVNGEANSQLQLAGSELLRRAGLSVQKECTEWVNQNGKLDNVSKCALTSAGTLKSKHIIHSPGVMWYGGKRDEERKLRDAVYHCLESAHKNQFKTISFPAMSVTALHSFKPSKCAENMIEAILDWIKFRSQDTTVSCIQIITSHKEAHRALEDEFDTRFKVEAPAEEEHTNDESEDQQTGATNEDDDTNDENEEGSGRDTKKRKPSSPLPSGKRGVKRHHEQSPSFAPDENASKLKKTDADAMKMTQDDAMQLTQMNDLMSLGGESLAVGNNNSELDESDLYL